MTEKNNDNQIILSLVIPCYNEESTLEECIKRVRRIADSNLQLEIIIVDDHSMDNTFCIAKEIAERYNEVKVLRHTENKGKGAALRTGFSMATGDFIAVQDADLEYNPTDLKKLLIPLVHNEADVVLGSRFLSTDFHRVLYFWHYLGNRFLTFLSNIFTDLNLTDMETCYKVFRKEVIQKIEIKENRFGFEPEIVAKIAHLRLRIFEAGISYHGRTYEEGKKIGVKDGFRALYCILKYNAYCAPIPVQFFLYTSIGGIAAIINLITFHLFFKAEVALFISTFTAFFVSAAANYVLCVLLLFKHKVRWNAPVELILYIFIVGIIATLDLSVTKFFISRAFVPDLAKAVASLSVFLLNFAGRRFLIFPDHSRGPWLPQKR